MRTTAEEGQSESRVNDPSVGSLPAGLFAAWRRTMSGAVSLVMRIGPGVRSLARTWGHQWPLVQAYHTDSALPWSAAGDDTRRAAAAVGLRAFVFGLIVAGISASASTSLWLPVAVDAGSQVLWAGMRFIIIALLMPRGAIDRTRLSTAYLAGLLPYAFAVTWVLRLSALALSAALTHRGLTGAGVPERDARTAVAWAFGGQAAIAVSGWAIRALIVLVAG
jgi:fumarate reductase subunit D